MCLFCALGEHPPKPPFWKPPFCQHQKGPLGDKRAVSKRVVLANVPSFRFSFRGNIRQNHPFGNHPFANPRKCTIAFRKGPPGIDSACADCPSFLVPGTAGALLPLGTAGAPCSPITSGSLRFRTPELAFAISMICFRSGPGKPKQRKVSS